MKLIVMLLYVGRHVVERFDSIDPATVLDAAGSEPRMREE